MKITESQLRNIISKTIKESMIEQNAMNQQTPFNALEETINDKSIELENKLNIIQYKISLLDKIIPVLTEVDAEIKKTFKGIQGPQSGKYEDWIIYTFAQPLQYDEETDTFGGYEGYIEENITQMFPTELQKFVDVYTNEKDGTISQIEIIIDIDNISELPQENY